MVTGTEYWSEPVIFSVVVSEPELVHSFSVGVGVSGTKPFVVAVAQGASWPNNLELFLFVLESSSRSRYDLQSVRHEINLM